MHVFFLWLVYFMDVRMKEIYFMDVRVTLRILMVGSILEYRIGNLNLWLFLQWFQFQILQNNLFNFKIRGLNSWKRFYFLFGFCILKK
jgi:hypothetical protein